MKAILSIMMVVAGCGATMQPGPTNGDDDTTDPHPVGELYGSVLDERGDTIDFSSGEPVHAHVGAAIDVGKDCPAVWKYAYLESEQAPMFGRETTPNPLAWHLRAPAATSEVAYRVRAADGRVLLDWTASEPGDDGIHGIALHRDGPHAVPELGTVMNMYLDARLRDSTGAVVVKTACWDNQPLAAPLDIGVPKAGALFGMTLAADSPISDVVNTGASIATFPFAQQTAEAIRIRIGATQPSGAMSKVVTSTFVRLGSVSPPPGSCDDSGDCAQPAMLRSSTMIDGILAGAWSVKIEDGLTGTVVCDDHALEVACVIPARLQGEAPHPYRAVVELAGETSLSVGAGTGEFTAASLHYTGLAPVKDGFYYCDHIGSHQEVSYCSEATQWALDRASVSFSPITLELRAAAGSDAGLVPPYLAPDALAFAARVWDAGDEGL